MEPLPPIGNAEQAEKEQPGSQAKDDKIEMLVSALVKINQSNHKADNAEHKRTDRREKRTFWLHIVEIVLITVYALFTILEWNTFSKESKIMGNEFKASQLSNSNQLVVLQGQSEEMHGQLNAMQIDERAWVFAVIQDNCLSNDGTNWIVQLQAKNLGKTPAIITGLWVSASGNESKIPERDPFCSGMDITVIPNGYQPIASPPMPDLTLELGITEYVWGTIYYSDIFGNPHWTQFCYALIDNGKSTKTMVNHNACDDTVLKGGK